MLINLQSVLTALYDRLRTDARTSGLTWLYGRREASMIQVIPAGVVAFGNIRDIPVLIPVGRESRIVLYVSVMTRHEKVDQAERDVMDWSDKVLEVLTTKADGTDYRDLQASPAVVIDSIDVEVNSWPEMDPPTARSTFTVNCVAHLH